MTPGQFVRISDGPYAGMTGRVMSEDRDGIWVCLTANGKTFRFARSQVQAEQRTSEQEPP